MNKQMQIFCHSKNEEKCFENSVFGIQTYFDHGKNCLSICSTSIFNVREIGIQNNCCVHHFLLHKHINRIFWQIKNYKSQNHELMNEEKCFIGIEN